MHPAADPYRAGCPTVPPLKGCGTWDTHLSQRGTERWDSAGTVGRGMPYVQRLTPDTSRRRLLVLNRNNSRLPVVKKQFDPVAWSLPWQKPCKACGQKIPHTLGRPGPAAQYCNATCRSRAYRARHSA